MPTKKVSSTASLKQHEKNLLAMWRTTPKDVKEVIRKVEKKTGGPMHLSYRLTFAFGYMKGHLDAFGVTK